MRTDVVVVGGGPIGLATARIAAEHGADVVVLERKSESAGPSCCTGLVGSSTLSVLGASEDSVLRRIRGVRIHTPSGRKIALRSDHVKAVVIDRARLECELRQRARDEHVALRFDAVAVDATPGLVKFRSRGTQHAIEARVLVGADGPCSQAASWLSLGAPSTHVAAAQFEIGSEALDADCVDIFVGESAAPGFFAWHVPAEPGVARLGVGVVAPHRPLPFLERLHAEQYPGARILRRCAGRIPMGIVRQSSTDWGLLVGDAAGQLKPLSGGGLFTGGLCARLAGEHAAQAALADGSTEEMLRTYPERCLGAIGKEIAFGMAVRHHFSRLTDRDIETLADAADDPHLLNFLAEHADIDRFHQLPDRLAGEPSLWKTLVRMIPLIGSWMDS